jgi:hypothetical protein
MNEILTLIGLVIGCFALLKYLPKWFKNIDLENKIGKR